MLLKHKDAIETHLKNRERHLFNLDEKILLYDLTNTFCPLVTLAMLMDRDQGKWNQEPLRKTF
jgi:hypothetical protein